MSEGCLLCTNPNEREARRKKAVLRPKRGRKRPPHLKGGKRGTFRRRRFGKSQGRDKTRLRAEGKGNGVSVKRREKNRREGSKRKGKASRLQVVAEHRL